MIIAPFVLKNDRDNFFLHIKNNDSIKEEIKFIGV
jgi:hypothetical protein